MKNPNPKIKTLNIFTNDWELVEPATSKQLWKMNATANECLQLCSKLSLEVIDCSDDLQQLLKESENAFEEYRLVRFPISKKTASQFIADLINRKEMLLGLCKQMNGRNKVVDIGGKS
jgi:hypothetical protein|tara:strand:+ start:109 stop:462 length:354 start_codon:yes stop_codon:yes gene_type:complete